MELTIGHNGMDWIVHVTDHDYDAPEARTRNHPGCLEDARVTDGYLQLDSKGKLVAHINAHLLERGDGPLFDMFIDLYQDSLTDQLLDAIRDHAEAQERDWEAEAEEAAFQKAEDYKNMEVKW